LTIGVVPKGATHEHWKRVHIGAEKAAAEFRAKGVSVEVIWKGPLREDDREQQVQVVEGFVSQRVSGLVLAPLDSRALVRPVEEACGPGSTVVFDSARGAAPGHASSPPTTRRAGARRSAHGRAPGAGHGVDAP
jgi:ribose transport system substrate-binding protein